ncbi:hypothetical protein [Sphingomonas sp.]|uniref:hypothetical protein n=1 Tax=Sphingomonas sp. TaxID=28214 RepID=UPI002ED9BC3F
MVFITALALVLAGQQVPGFATHYNGWKLVPTDNGCMILKAFERDVVIGIRYDARRNDLRLAVGDPTFRSLKEGEIYKLDILLTLKDGRSVEFSGVPFAGTTGSTPSIFTDSLNGRDFMTHAETSSRIKINRGDISVADIDISYGSGGHIWALRRCAEAKAKADPSDPFKD